MKPKVSVVTPVFNAGIFLADTYECLKSQTFQDWEWCVYDDCSKDDSYSILCGFAAEDHRVRCFRGASNRGAAYSRNFCIDAAKGEYIAFLDSDDLWLPGKLQEQIDFMDCGHGFTFTPYELVEKDGSPTGKFVDLTAPDRISYEDLLRKRATFGCSTVIVERALLNGNRMPDIRAGQDYAFWLQLMRVGVYAVKYEAPLSKYRIVPGSLSRNKFRKAIFQWRIYREVEHLDVRKAVQCFFYYARNAIFRR